jgi:predicted lactoylglutathione lyase
MKMRCFLVLSVSLIVSIAAHAQHTQHVAKGSLLGTPTRLVMSCKDIIKSMSWWTKLGFNPVPGIAMHPDSALSLTDGQVIITLVKESLPSPILMFSSSRIKDLRDTLAANNINTTFDLKGPSLGEIRLLSPNGVYIAVRPVTDEPVKPVSGDSNIICGRVTEFSIGTSTLKPEREYWEHLGFTIKRTATIPYPYALMTDGSIVVGLHENRDIPTLTITYFAEDMVDRIDRLRKSGVEITEELADPSGKLANGRVISPDGQIVFLFNGSQ